MIIRPQMAARPQVAIGRLKVYTIKVLGTFAPA